MSVLRTRLLALLVVLTLLFPSAVMNTFAAASDNAFNAFGCTAHPRLPVNQLGIIYAEGNVKCNAANASRDLQIALWQLDSQNKWQLIEDSTTYWNEVNEAGFDDDVATLGLNCRNLEPGRTRKY